MDDTFEELNRVKQDIEEPRYWTNKISPVRVLIYEDTSESSKNICAALTRMQIGVVVSTRNDDAKQALQDFPTIRIYVADHRATRKKGLIKVNSVRFHSKYVKEQYPFMISVLLGQKPEDGATEEFVLDGGSVINTQNKTEDDLAQALIDILNTSSQTDSLS